MTTKTTAARAATGDDDTALHPFTIAIPQIALDDLRDRLARARWPDQLPGAGWSRGVSVAYLRDLADYWRRSYDWRTHEAALNQFPQFTTTIAGQAIHFLHVRSPEPGAVPLLLTHSWPGSVVEYVRLIGPLSDPRAHGGDPASAFHLIIPSIPGFGFSAPPREIGWTIARVADIWATLMARLGYDRYGLQGNDAGALIAPTLAKRHPERVSGVHLTGGVGFPHPDDLKELNEDERARYAAMGEMVAGGSFIHTVIQAARPQTFAYGLTDSPIAQLAWIAEKFKEWTDHDKALPEEAVDRDQLLTNVTLYWLTKTAASSMWLYYENQAGWAPAQALVPTGNMICPNDPSLRRLAERENRITHWSTFDRGGHFAAMEVPELLIGDLRDFFRQLR